MIEHRVRVLSLVIATAVLVAVPLSVEAQRNGAGPGPGGAQGGTALTTFQTADFSGSGICASCHSALTDDAGNDVSNDAHWRSSMMANSARDPLWQAKISSEVDRNPGLKAIIEDKCSRCHMGMARYQTVTDGTVVEVLPPGFLDRRHPLHEAAMDGVSCTLCHQIQSGNLGTPSSYTGDYVIETTTDPPNRVIFGPYEQPMVDPMQQAAAFIPTFGAHKMTSEECGTCHTLYTPVVDDATGNPIPDTKFPEQTTYLEWKYAGVQQTCQDCHLPDAVGPVVISNRPRWLGSRTPFGQHHFVGGNTFMVDLHRTNAVDLGMTADTVHFDATLARTLTQLATNTALLTVGATRREGGRLEVTVDVTNLAGHKLPSGLPSRRAWLHVTVVDSTSAVVFESGRPLTDGRIEGNDAETDPTTWEPHYTMIETADQVQIYEPIMRSVSGQVTHTLLYANEYVKDNRLLPAGFVKEFAEDDIAVYGLAHNDDDFVGGSDQVVYTVDVVDAAAGALEVTVELLFQTVSNTFLTDLAQTTTDEVTRFMTMYDPAKNLPEVLAAGQVSVD
jgi:hypothetical protein